MLSENERRFLNHNIRWGSDGYPITKVKGGWIWHESWGIKGTPVVYKTKKAAGEAIEKYVDILADKAAGRI
jgi:hypothetical protein